jgi:hypothetical protein
MILENDNNSPRRDKKGLLIGTKYIFSQDGLIDWRKMVKDKWLYPNPGKGITETDVSKMEDRDLCILLGGIKELARIRGYSSIDYSVSAPSQEYVVVTCTIKWIPNFETAEQEISFSSIADASFGNTSAIGGVHYLAPIAENRAFVRAVRNFLNINIVGKDELASLRGKAPVSRSEPISTSNKMIDPHGTLELFCNNIGVCSFDDFKIKISELQSNGKLNNLDQGEWANFKSIDPKDVRKILATLKQK